MSRYELSQLASDLTFTLRAILDRCARCVRIQLVHTSSQVKSSQVLSYAFLPITQTLPHIHNIYASVEFRETSLLLLYISAMFAERVTYTIRRKSSVINFGPATGERLPIDNMLHAK